MHFRNIKAEQVMTVFFGVFYVGSYVVLCVPDANAGRQGSRCSMAYFLAPGDVIPVRTVQVCFLENIRWHRS